MSYPITQNVIEDIRMKLRDPSAKKITLTREVIITLIEAYENYEDLANDHEDLTNDYEILIKEHESLKQ